MISPADNDDLVWAAALAAVLVLLWRWRVRRHRAAHLAQQRVGTIISRLAPLRDPPKEGAAHGTDDHLR